MNDSAPIPMPPDPREHPVEVECPRCEGHGSADWNEPDGDESGCVRCNGTGRVREGLGAERVTLVRSRDGWAFPKRTLVDPEEHLRGLRAAGIEVEDFVPASSLADLQAERDRLREWHDASCARAEGAEEALRGQGRRLDEMASTPYKPPLVDDWRMQLALFHNLAVEAREALAHPEEPKDQ